MKSPSSLTGTVLTPQKTIRRGTIRWDEAGVITEITETAPVERGSLRDLLICPGFINLHVHGGAGADTLDATAGALSMIARDQARQGVTSFLPTTASARREELIAVCRAIGEFTAHLGPAGEEEAKVLGLHLEGPYFNPARAGAQNPVCFHDPDWEEFEAFQSESAHAVRLISLAPERDSGGAFIRRLREAGVFVAAGHTDADYATMQRAIEAGVSQATHVFNAMPGLHHRGPTGLNALLEDDRVMLELIPDCEDLPHVHPAAIRLLKRIAGPDRICMITDAVSAAGRPDGVYQLGELAIRKLDNTVFLEEPWAESGERRLAGSALAMNAGVRNLVELCGFTVEEAVRTATTNPARAIGIEADRGSLGPGRQADITVLFQDTFEVAETYVCGVRVYSHG